MFSFHVMGDVLGLLPGARRADAARITGYEWCAALLAFAEQVFCGEAGHDTQGDDFGHAATEKTGLSAKHFEYG